MEEDEFVQVILVEDREGNALLFWYSSPTVKTEFFGSAINRILTEYRVSIMLGDFNAIRPNLCARHDDKKKGLQLIKEVRKVPGHRIHASRQPTFQAPRNRNRGTFGSSNIDLIVARVPIRNMTRLEGRIAERSDHFPVWFQAYWLIDRGGTTRCIPKTLFQSKQMRETA